MNQIQSNIVRSIPPDIAQTPFDAIIIGAGINGAGIARDAAMRGLKVLLLDKGDISGGTTSWSTRLIHGGLRYLEHGEVGLVRESLRERETLLRIAPHLVRPLPMVVPVYEKSKRGALMIRAGMAAYDLLSFDKSLARHHMLARAETLKRVPGLNTEALQGAAVYYDAQVEYAERLALENALAAREHGATILTYARVDRLLVERGQEEVQGVEFTDLLGGGVHAARARVTINVAGPWVDEVLRGLNRPAQRMIGGTKGSHLVVAAFPGAPRDALYTEAREDGRPFFIIPWANKLLIGTTDVHFKGDLDYVEADEKEVDYLLRETNHLIPSAKLTRDSILFTYSGVRPLPYVPERAEQSVTRRHFIHDHEPEVKNFISIVGGKLTTYRSLSEQTVNTLFKKLGQRPPRCATSRVPLPGATGEDYDAFSKSFVANSGLPEATACRLRRIYGTRATEVLELCAERPSLRKPFDAVTGALGAEVLMSFQREMAATLTDCLMRRTMVGLERGIGLEACEAAAKIAQEFLGWNESHAAQQVAAYRNYTGRFRCRKSKNREATDGQS